MNGITKAKATIVILLSNKYFHGLEGSEVIYREIGLVLRPGFEPGSTAREAVILDRTILPERGLDYFSNVFAIYSHFVSLAAGMNSKQVSINLL